MKARNNVEANAVVAYLVEKSGRDTYRRSASRRPRRGPQDLRDRSAAWPATASATTAAAWTRRCPTAPCARAWTRPPSAPMARTSTAPAARSSAGWLFSWIKNPKGYWHDTRMPNLRVSDKEAADITAYLMSLKNDDFLARPRPPLQPALRDELIREHLLAANVPMKDAEKQIASMDDHQRTIFVGEKTIGRYGCFGCHTISGFEKASPIGVELTEEGSKLVERLDFGFEEGKIPHTLPGWVHRKVMEPRVFDAGKRKRPEELLRMPKFHATDEEADAHHHRRHVLLQGAGAAGRAEAAHPRRALRRARGAPGAGPQLPRLPRARRPGRLHPGGGGRPAGVLRPRLPERALADRRLLAAAALQREREDRRGHARADGLAAHLPDAIRRNDPALGEPAHAHLRVRRGAAQRPDPLLRVAGQGRLSRTRRGPSPTRP